MLQLKSGLLLALAHLGTDLLPACLWHSPEDKLTSFWSFAQTASAIGILTTANRRMRVTCAQGVMVFGAMAGCHHWVPSWKPKTIYTPFMLSGVYGGLITSRVTNTWHGDMRASTFFLKWAFYWDENRHHHQSSVRAKSEQNISEFNYCPPVWVLALL